MPASQKMMMLEVTPKDNLSYAALLPGDRNAEHQFVQPDAAAGAMECHQCSCTMLKDYYQSWGWCHLVWPGIIKSFSNKGEKWNFFRSQFSAQDIKRSIKIKFS